MEKPFVRKILVITPDWAHMSYAQLLLVFIKSCVLIKPRTTTATYACNGAYFGHTRPVSDK